MTEKREITKTEAGTAYQIEVLSKELKRLRKKLADQLALFDAPTMTKDVDTVKAELERLQQCYGEMCGVTSRLSPLLGKEKAEEIDEKLRWDGESVGKVGGAVKEWMKALEEVDNKSIRSSVSRSSRQTVKSKKDLEEESDEKKTPGTAGVKSFFEIMQAHSRLESQITLVDDVLQLEDDKMIKPELETLVRRYKDLLALSEKLPESELTEENLKVAGIVETATERVNGLKKKAKGVLAEIAEGRGSVVSEGSKRSGFRSSKNKDQESRRCFGRKDDRDTVSERGGKEKRTFGTRATSDIGRVDKNIGGFGMYGFYNDHMSTQKEKIIHEASRLQKRIETEVSLTESLLEVGGREVLQRRLDKLDRIEEEISSVHFQVRQLYIRIEDGDKVLKQIVQKEDKIRDHTEFQWSTLPSANIPLSPLAKVRSDVYD